MKNILVALILSVVALQVFAQKMDKDLWLQDLDAYKTGLEQKHIDVYNKISEAEFESELALIKSSIDNKTDFQVVMDLMRLTRKIGDGHTAISLSNMETHNFPFEVKQFGNDWRIVKIAKPFGHLLGTKLLAVDGTRAPRFLDTRVAIAGTEQAVHVDARHAGQGKHDGLRG